MSFLAEIKRRKVFQVAAVYIVVAWAIVQVVVVVIEPLSLPDWMDTFVIVLVAAGFPLAIILSWAYDITPEGIVRATESEGSADGRPEAAAPEGGTEIGNLPNSVAVLPFENLSPNPDDAYFAAGIHEELLNQLAKVRDLRVIARTSVVKYGGSGLSVSEIASELRVGTVVEGSVRYAGDRVRVTAQLIDGETEHHLWSEIYERDLADIFAVQADIAIQITTALKAELSSADRKLVERPLTRSPEAYAKYLQAMTLSHRGGMELVANSPQLATKIRSHLDEAIAADSDFAMAYVLRARLCVNSLFFDTGTEGGFATRRKTLEDLALNDFETALALDPDLGIAYAGIALMHQYSWRRKDAQAAHEQALQLRPNDPQVLSGIAMFKAITGQHETAEELGKRALMLDPGSAAARFWMAMVYLAARNVHAAVNAFRRLLELAPASGIAHANLSLLETARGNASQALEEARLAEQLMSDNLNPAHLSVAIYAYGMAGNAADAQRVFERLEEAARIRRVAPPAWTVGYLGLRDREQALRWLKKTADNREPYEAFYSVIGLKLNWFFDPVMEEPAFKGVRARLGFPD